MQILRTLGRAGYRSWLVGGAVRDELLGRVRLDPNEFDVATPATPHEVGHLFRSVVPTGIEHGTVTVLKGSERVEVTTFRGEGAYVDGRRPSSVTFHTNLEEDLSRRDFTVNALAWDPLTGEFRDPFGGLADLRRHLIRAVGKPRERFGEDGLRPLRAVRFAAELGFALERRTRSAIRPALPVVEQVSRERVAAELSRLLTGSFAAEGLRLLAQTGLLQTVVPALASLPASTLRHAVAVASMAFAPCASLARRRTRAAPAEVDRERCRLLRLAGLLHVLPPETAMQAVVELRLPNRLAVGVARILGARPCLRLSGADPFPEEPVEVRRWLSSVGPSQAADVLDFLASDARHQGRASRKLGSKVRALRRRVGAELQDRPALSVGELALDGLAVMRILGIGGGPAVGEALRYLLDFVVEDPARNDAGVLEATLGAWWAGRTP